MVLRLQQIAEAFVTADCLISEEIDATEILHGEWYARPAAPESVTARSCYDGDRSTWGLVWYEGEKTIAPPKRGVFKCNLNTTRVQPLQ
jgi:hypothetical protein